MWETNALHQEQCVPSTSNFLQLGAYTLAHNVVYKTNITLGAILLCTVDNFYQEFKIEGSELLMYQNLFLERVKKFKEISN